VRRLSHAWWKVLSLAALALVVGCGGKPGAADAAPVPPDADPIDAAPPPPPVDAAPAPPLPPIEGASKEAGQALYVKLCGGCHGPDGRGQTEQARTLRRPPTDLATVGYLCRTTDGRPFAVPSEADVEGAITRGTHAGVEALAGLSPVQRRSLMLFVRTLAPEFANATSPPFEVPAGPPPDPASRERGRILYLATGCWRCHGLDGKGGDKAALGSIRWNGLPLAGMTDLTAEATYLCGTTAEATYRVIALGMIGEGATIMPRYQEFLEDFARPAKGAPADWTKSLDGKATPDEIARVRAFLETLPAREALVTGTPPEQRKARAAAFMWDLVHYLREGM
jgi:mono/diheme cytochrome c family protein